MEEENKTNNKETEELIDTEQEHLTEDTDADTKDIENSDKNDEEQIVEDTDANTKDVMGAIERMSNDISNMRGQLIAMKDMFSQYVDAGGIVREEDYTNEPIDNTVDYIPIEELDLTL